jgi:O-antigen ligase/Tfp pilus assembly protein PilF
MDKTKKYLNKAIELSLLAALFLAPLSFWLPANESFELPKSVNFFVFIIIAFCLLLIRQAMDGSFTFRFTSFSLPAAGIVIAAFLSMLKGAAINMKALPMHWQFFKLLAASAMLYFLIINIFTRKDVFKLLFFILAAHFIVVIYGIFQYFGVDFIKWVSFGEGRVYSTMGNPDYMAAQFSILIPVMIVLVLSPVRNVYRFMISLFLLLMFFLIIVSHGRGAWLGFLGSLLYMLILVWIMYGKEFFIKYRIVFAGIAAFAVLLAVIFSFPNPLNRNSRTIMDRLESGLDFTSDSVAVRLFYWESALQMAKYNPLFGAGIGGFSLNTAFYQRKVFDRWEKKLPKMAAKVEPHVELYTHNDFLQTLAETGFIGFGAFIWLFFTALVKPFSRLMREENQVIKNILLGITGSVIAYLINALLNFPWRVMPTLVLLWSLFAVFSILETKKTVKVRAIPQKLLRPALVIAAVFLSALQVDPLVSSTCIKDGQSAFAGQRFGEARDTFLRGLRSNPRGTDIIELVLYAGNAYNSLGDVNKSIEYYNNGLAMFPNFIESHYNVANVYMNNGMNDKAIEEYNKVLALNPKFSSAYNNMANIFYKEKDWEPARIMYEKALAIKPDSLEARYNLGATYFSMKKYKEAYEELNKVLLIDPGYMAAREWMKKMKDYGLVK